MADRIKKSDMSYLVYLTDEGRPKQSPEITKTMIERLVAAGLIEEDPEGLHHRLSLLRKYLIWRSWIITDAGRAEVAKAARATPDKGGAS